MKPALLALAGTLCLAPTLATATVTELEVGKTLKCQSTGPDRKLYVTIGRIETHTDGRIVVSVSIYNRSPKSGLPELAHAAIDAGVLSASCPTPAGGPIPISPNFEEGYQQWRSAKGRVFTVSVDRIYDVLVDQVAKARQGGQGVQ